MTDAIRIPVRAPSMHRRLADLRVEDVHPDPQNVRRVMADVDELAASMRERGLVQPVLVRRDPDKLGYTLVAGHRRYAAAVQLGWQTIPATVRDPMDPADARELMYMENAHRVALDPIEEAGVLSEMFARHKFGSARQLAGFVGRSEGYVRDRLALLDLDAGTQERVTAKQVTIGTAARAARKPRAEATQAPVAARKVGPRERLANGRAHARKATRALGKLEAALVAEGVDPGRVPELADVRLTLAGLLEALSDGTSPAKKVHTQG